MPSRLWFKAGGARERANGGVEAVALIAETRAIDEVDWQRTATGRAKDGVHIDRVRSLRLRRPC
jgi:hypothetical protein